MKLEVMIIVRIAKRALVTVPYGGCIELLLVMSTCASCRKNSKVSSFYGTVKIATANIKSLEIKSGHFFSPKVDYRRSKFVCIKHFSC